MRYLRGLMVPLLAIIGRPNVGKSSLFNRLVGRQKALVHPMSGVTRDRNYEAVAIGGRRFILVDTGGMDPRRLDDDPISVQARHAVEEADGILFLLDGKSGLTPDDGALVARLRGETVPIFYAVNKIDGREHEDRLADFYTLGVDLLGISAAHGYQIAELCRRIVGGFPEADPARREEEELQAVEKPDGDAEGGPEEAPPEEDPARPVHVAILGRPNSGKSTLVNHLLGRERMIVSPEPGTTREAIDTVLERDGRRWIVVDTAGIRKKRRIGTDLEKQMVWSGLRAAERADAACLMVDAREGLGEQDVRLAEFLIEQGRALILVLNKWDLVEKDGKTFDNLVKDLRALYPFLKAVPILSVSALGGQRVDRLFPLLESVVANARRRVPTGEFNRFLERLQQAHSIPLHKQHAVKIFYASQVGVQPPAFLFSCSNPSAIHSSYRRFMVRRIREEFGFDGTPIRMIFKGRGRHAGEREVHAG